MKKKFSRILGVGLALVLALALVVLVLPGCASKAPPPTTKELPIGVVVSLTGPASASHVIIKDTVALEAEKINAEGGIKVGNERYLIKLINGDDKWSAEGGRAAIEKLVYSDKVKYVVGPWCSVSTLAMEPVQEPNKVLQVTGSLADKAITPQLTYKFRAMSSAAEQAVPFMTYVAQANPKLKRVAMIGQASEYGRSTAFNYTYAAKVTGMEVVADEYHAAGDVDFYSVLTKILAKNPQIFLINETGESYPLVTKQLWELGYRGLILSSSPPDWQMTIKVAGAEAVEGHLCVGSLTGGTAAIDDFNKRYEARFAKPADPLVYVAWNYLDILKQAIEKAQSLDTTVVRDVMESMEFEVYEGEARWGGEARYGIAHAILLPVAIHQIEGGKPVFRSISPPAEPPPFMK